MRIKKEQLSEMRGRADAATKGPWDYAECDGALCVDSDETGDDIAVITNARYDGADFVCAARSDIPLLIEALESAYALIEKKDEALRFYAHLTDNCHAYADPLIRQDNYGDKARQALEEKP